MNYDRRKAKVALRGAGAIVVLDLLWFFGDTLFWTALFAMAFGYAALMCFEPYFDTFKPFRLNDPLPPDQQPIDIKSRSRDDLVYRVFPKTFVYLTNDTVDQYRVRFTYIKYNQLIVWLIQYVPWVFEASTAYAYRSVWFGVLKALLGISEFDASIGANTVATLRKISDARESSAVELVTLMAFTSTYGNVLGNVPDLANYAIKELLTRMEEDAETRDRGTDSSVVPVS